MDMQDIRTSEAEPVTQLEQQSQANARARMDANTAPEQVDDYQAENQAPARNPLPFWLEEKFYWHTSESGYSRLRPKVEFLNAIIADAPKMEMYGYRQAFPDDQETHESELVGTLKAEAAALLQTVNALHEREYNALGKFFRQRCIDNAVFAAITQFEIDNWVARSAQQGKSAAAHENFGEKESRRDSLAIASAVWGRVAREVLGSSEGLTNEDFAKATRSNIYTRADIETRNQSKPELQNQQQTAEVQAAVAASRPI